MIIKMKPKRKRRERNKVPWYRFPARLIKYWLVKLSKTSEILGSKNILTYFSLQKADVTDYVGNFSSPVLIKHKTVNHLK